MVNFPVFVNINIHDKMYFIDINKIVYVKYTNHTLIIKMIDSNIDFHMLPDKVQDWMTKFKKDCLDAYNETNKQLNLQALELV